MILKLSGTQEGINDADRAAQRAEESRRAEQRLDLERKQEERLAAQQKRQMDQDRISRAARGMQSIGNRLQSFKGAGTGAAMTLSEEEQWAATESFGVNVTSLRPVSDAAGTGWEFYADGSPVGIVYDAGTAEVRKAEPVGKSGVMAYYALEAGRHDLPDALGGGSTVAKPGDLLFYRLPDGTITKDVDPEVVNPAKEKPKAPSKTNTEGAAAQFESVLDERMPWPTLPGKESTLPAGDERELNLAIKALEEVESRSDEQDAELEQLRRHMVVLKQRKKSRERLTSQFKGAYDRTGDYDSAIAEMEAAGQLNRETKAKREPAADWPPKSVSDGMWPAMTDAQDATVKRLWPQIVERAGGEEEAVRQLTALLREGKL